MSGTYNISARQGNTLNFQFTIQTGSTLWNITNWTGVMTARPFLGATSTWFTATTENGYMVLDGVAGKVTVTLPSSLLASLPAQRGVYDLNLNSGSQVYGILEGRFTVDQAVTE